MNNNWESKNNIMKIKIIISVNILLIEIDFLELSTYQSIFSKRFNNNGNLKWDIFLTFTDNNNSCTNRTTSFMYRIYGYPKHWCITQIRICVTWTRYMFWTWIRLILLQVKRKRLLSYSQSKKALLILSLGCIKPHDFEIISNPVFRRVEIILL